LAVTVAALGLALLVLPVALDTKSRIAEFHDLDVAQLFAHDSAVLEDLQESVDGLENDVRPVAAYLRWVARLAPAISWIPGVGHEAREWAAQLDRLQGDLAAVAGALTASSSLLQAYIEAETALTRVDSSGPVPQLALSVELEATFDTALAAVRRASRSSRGDVPVYRPARIRDAMGTLEEIEARMLSAFSLGREASGLLGELAVIVQQVRPIVGPFVSDSSQSAPTTVEELRRALVDVDEGLRFASVRSQGLVRRAAGTGQSEALKNRLDVLDDVLKVLLNVNSATVLVLSAVQPALEGGPDSSEGVLGGRLLRTLEALVASESDLDRAIALMGDARTRLADLETRAGLVGGARGLEELSKAVERIGEGIQLARDFAPIGLDMVGRDSVRRYLLLGQSADELRATGGFVSAVWLLTFDGGELADIQYFDAVRVDDYGRLNLYPPAPPGLEQHMNALVWLMRDVSWEPDFPTTARTAADMFRIGQRQEVDGVIAMNQWTLLSLIEALGAVASPEGDDLTSHNLFARIEKGTDVHGRAYVDLALEGVVERLSEPISLPELMSVASALHRSLEERDLLFYLDDRKQQVLIEAAGWDGGIRQNATDYLYVVDSNVGWSKADRNIERRLRYTVDLGKPLRARATLNLAYYNHSGPGSAGCVPQWLNQGTNYSDLKNACWWNYWRVYVPQGSKLLSSTHLGLPEYSVAVEIGRGQPDDDTVTVSSSFDKTVVSGLFALGAGNSTEVNLIYDLPIVVDRSGGEIDYRLLIQKQPGSRSRGVEVEFVLPPGYTLVSSSIAPAFEEDSRVAFTLVAERDTVLTAVFAKGSDSAG
jgi:hypothetical protein